MGNLETYFSIHTFSQLRVHFENSLALDESSDSRQGYKGETVGIGGILQVEHTSMASPHNRTVIEFVSILLEVVENVTSGFLNVGLKLNYNIYFTWGMSRLAT